MKYNKIIKKYIKNSTIQNVILIIILFVLWFVMYLNIQNSLKSISKININNFNNTMNHYYYHLKYISLINDESLLKDVNIKSFFVINKYGTIRKSSYPSLNYKTINNTPLFQEILKKHSGIFLVKSSLFSDKKRVFVGGAYNKTFLLGELTNLDFEQDANYHFSILNENNNIIYSKFNLQSMLGKWLIYKKRFYLNSYTKWNDLIVATSLDITYPLITNIIISIFILSLIMWNFLSRVKNRKLMNIFEKEFSIIIKSMEKFLKELRVLDKQTFLSISEKDFEDILKPIRDVKFFFDDLNEIKEVESLSIKEIIDLFDEISASTEELEATNKELEDLYIQVEKAYSDLENSYRKFSSHLSAIAEKYDEITGSHIDRVAKYSKLIAEKMGFDIKFVNDIEAYAPLHDIGKLMIKHEILNKPGGLTTDEYEEMKKHTIYAEKIFGNDKRFEMAKNIAIFHHETYDGKGYPFGLKGDEIPIEARIVALADIYDALRSERPYKDEYTHEETYNIIVNGDFKTKPTIFDPNVLEVFKKYHLEFDKIYNEYKEKEKNTDIEQDYIKLNLH